MMCFSYPPAAFVYCGKLTEATEISLLAASRYSFFDIMKGGSYTYSNPLSMQLIQLF